MGGMVLCRKAPRENTLQWLNLWLGKSLGRPTLISRTNHTTDVRESALIQFPILRDTSLIDREAGQEGSMLTFKKANMDNISMDARYC